jgi:transposase
VTTVAAATGHTVPDLGERRFDGSNIRASDYGSGRRTNSNRILHEPARMLTQIHPALERAIGARLQHKAVLELLSRFGGPAGLRAAGRRRLSAVTKPRAPRIHATIVDAIMTALDQQTVVVPGSSAAELVLPRLANQLTELLAQRAHAARQVEEILDVHPLAQVLTSMPGIAARTGARILLEVGDGSHFPTSGQLAAYAGLTPVTRRSGTSIRGEHLNRGGNKKLKNAMFQAAFASLSDPASRTYYDRKRAEHKKHNAAIICLARRRCDVLYGPCSATAPATRPGPPPPLDKHPRDPLRIRIRSIVRSEGTSNSPDRQARASSPSRAGSTADAPCASR